MKKENRTDRLQIPVTTQEKARIERARMKKENRTDRLQIPVTTQEKARIERAAGLSEMTVSEWVRCVLRQKLKGDSNK